MRQLIVSILCLTTAISAICDTTPTLPLAVAEQFEEGTDAGLESINANPATTIIVTSVLLARAASPESIVKIDERHFDYK